jgi:hypothetical protein
MAYCRTTSGIWSSPPTVQPPVALARVVVDEGDRERAEPGVRAQLAGHHRPRRAGAGDQHAAARPIGGAPPPRARRPIPPAAHHEARDRHGQPREEPVEEQDRERHARERGARHEPDAEADAEPHARQDDARGQQVLEVSLPGVPPEPRVEPHAPKRHEPQWQGYEHVGDEHPAYAGRELRTLEAREERHPRRDREESGIEGEEVPVPDLKHHAG